MKFSLKESRYAATALLGAGLFGAGLALSPMSQAEPIEPRDRDRNCQGFLCDFGFGFDPERDLDELRRDLREAAEREKREAAEREKGEAAEREKREAAEREKREAAEREEREAIERMERDRVERAELEAAEREEREAAERAEREELEGLGAMPEAAEREAEDTAPEPEAAEPEPEAAESGGSPSDPHVGGMYSVISWSVR